MTLRCVAAVLLAIAGMAAGAARAQDPGPQAAAGTGLALAAWSVDGGGGRSTGGGYALVGSTAQPDAEPWHPASGGGYTVVGGFLPAAAANDPATDPLFADGFEG